MTNPITSTGHPPSWPRARPAPPVAALFKASPADFEVHEQLSFEPSGSGEHLYVRLIKTTLGTPDLARRLADAHGLQPVDVGYAGMKDKHAVTTQWFSLRGARELAAAVAEWDDVEIETTTRHEQKLRRGQIVRNGFRVVLRDLDALDIGDRLEGLGRDGAPNYFGRQRFGWDNLDNAAAWLAVRRRRRVSRFKQGLYLSVLRSFLFNQVLAARVRAANFATSLDGDVLEQGLPTGPLWGRGRSPAGLVAAELEQEALAPYQEILEGLEHAGLTQDRRALSFKPTGLGWQLDDRALTLHFELPAGCYATSLLDEVFALTEQDTTGEQSRAR